MNTFEAIAAAELAITVELEKEAAREGTPIPETTGNIFVDSLNEAVWFEISSHGYTSLVSLDYPSRAAHEEKLVGVQNREEALEFGDGSYNL